MITGKFTGYEVSVTEPGIAWIEFNEPEKLNGMSIGKKRDLIETLTQAQMDNAIRVINGVTIQTGLSLALACDFKIAAASAKLGSATLRFGLLPDEGGQYLLMQHLGLAKTMDFIIRKRIVNAQEAMSLGLVNSVVPDSELRTEVAALAEEFANGPQVAMRMMKRSVYQAAELTFDQACDEIAAKTAVTDHHPDTKEGVSAFHEKRTPEFNAWLKNK